MTRNELNRRRFLKAVGATALTYPFVRALPSYAAAAGTTTDPQYLVLIFTPVGVVRPNWGAIGPARPTGTAALASPLTGADGGMGAFRTGPACGSNPGRSTLAPLAAAGLTDQTIVLDGLNVATANGSHEAGMAALWTGQLNNGPGTGATSISIDQAIATQLNANTPFPTIPLMVRDSADFTDREVKTRMLYGSSAGSVGFVDPMDSPIEARSTLFGNASSAASSSGPSAQSVIRNLVFKQTNAELTTLQGKLCNQDLAQLQAYQQMWNDLDTQLQAAQMQAASCMPPEAIPSGYSVPSADFPTSAKLQMDILAFALACDLSRVGSIQFSTATSQVTHSWIDNTQTDIHHNYSHDGPGSFYTFAPYMQSGTPDIYDVADYSGGVSAVCSPSQYLQQLASIDIWYTQQIAYLAQKLAGLQTVTGKNLLAQTVICTGSELDMGAAHNHDDTPFLLIGGGGGKLKTGQLVQFPLNLANGVANSPPTNNRFHNDLLVTLAQVMGVNMSTFGSTSGTSSNGNVINAFNQGPIMEILNT